MLIARINNLLDVTAFESRGVSVLKKSDIDIPSFVHEIVESLELSAMQREVRIVIDPSVEEAGVFRADPQTMHHVFFNLMANAVKYTNPNTEVRIAYERSPRMHVFCFVDQGPGMSAHDQAHIFEGMRPVSIGSGLDSLTRTAELHGGSVNVMSTLGEESRLHSLFRVRPTRPSLLQSTNFTMLSICRSDFTTYATLPLSIARAT